MANDKAGQKDKTSADFNQSAAADPRVLRRQALATLKSRLPVAGSGNEYTTFEGEKVTPTKNQKELIRDLGNKDMVFVEGSFGTGKTMWATYMALKGLVDDEFKKIIITSPACESGEEIGFLPGDADDKMLPYVIQMLQSFEEWVGEDVVQTMRKSGLIKIVPFAHMRGLNFKNAFCIVDEAQNASGPQLLTSFGRFGKGARMVYLGDDSQNDRTDTTSAYVAFVQRFTQAAYKDHTAHVRMKVEDVKRHPFLQKVVENKDHRPLEGYESHNPKSDRRKSQTPAVSASVAAPVATPQ